MKVITDKTTYNKDAMTTKTKVSALLTTIAIALVGVIFSFANEETSNNVVKENIVALSEKESTSNGLDLNDPTRRYCRCKKDSDGIRGCYAGNWISFRANCTSDDTHCRDNDPDCNY